MRKWDNVTYDQLSNIIEILKHHFDPALSHKVIELFHERMQDEGSTPLARTLSSKLTPS